ncbi:hypothetical protein [Pseudomonas putida]|uniref:hypothetical protein n=1 Tax=Pseudomonas TaxID=286 RepID=UPI0021F858DC|nr:hypothetical protein [Pseudomonas putida]
MVKLLLSCAMQGILGATFYPTKQTFSCALSRKKLSPQKCAKHHTKTPLKFATGHAIQGLRRFIGKHQLNTIFAIRAASLVWLQTTAVLQTDLTTTA